MFRRRRIGSCYLKFSKSPEVNILSLISLTALGIIWCVKPRHFVTNSFCTVHWQCIVLMFQNSITMN